MRGYEYYKARFNNTKPIRGRDVEVRPIGDRRRTHETVTQKKLLSGEVSYCAKLYGTEVVEYHNNGDITLRTGSWETPSTAEFIHTHSPFTCFKQNGRLWVRVRTSIEGNAKVYPVGNELTLREVDTERLIYEPINRVLIKKLVVDRDKAKAARAPLAPFLSFAKAFMGMSDGWLMHETRKQVIETQETEWGRMFIYGHKGDERAKFLYQLMASTDNTEYNYLHALFRILNDKYDALKYQVAETVTKEYAGYMGKMTKSTTEFHDMRFDYDLLKRRVYKIAEEAVDIKKVVEVEPSGKTMSGVVR